jgi:hypothetical protein
LILFWRIWTGSFQREVNGFAKRFLPFKERIKVGMVSMQDQTNKTILQSNLQRKLRRNMTDAEKKLWRVLRGRQLSGLNFAGSIRFRTIFLISFALKIRLSLK